MVLFVTMKPVSGQCNLSCEYCFYKQDRGMMSMEIVQRVIDQCLPTDVIGWQGGEPTLAGLDFYRKIYDLWPYQHSIMTNAVLINNEWADFLAEKKFLVGVSLDGDEKTHNTYRSNWRETIEGLRQLVQRGVYINVLVTVNRANWHQGELIYHMIVDEGVDYIQLIPVVGEFGISGEQWGRFLLDVLKEWVVDGVNKVGIQLFDECYRIIAGGAHECCIYSSECCGLVVEADGMVFCCEHFPDTFGNVMDMTFGEMARSQTFLDFAAKKIDPSCMECDFRVFCNSGCPKHRNPHNILCAGYRRFFVEFERMCWKLVDRLV